MKKYSYFLVVLAFSAIAAVVTAQTLPQVTVYEGKSVYIPGGELVVPDIRVTDDLAVSDDTTISGDASVAGTLTLPSSLVATVSTKAAAGNAIGNATALTSQVTYVTDSNGARGVKLYDAAIGAPIIVHNTVNAQNLLLYPPDASGTINGGAGGASVTVGGEETAVLIKVAANTWYGGVAVDF